MTAPLQQPVRRALAVVFALQGQTFHGLRLHQIAAAIGDSAPTALRCLEVLADEGIVERIAGREGFWRLGPRLVQLAIAHQHEAHALHQRVGEFDQRYSRFPT